MSFDPFNADRRDQPFEGSQPYPADKLPYPPYAPPVQMVRERLIAPAILLLLLALLNLLFGLLQGFATLNAYLVPAEVAHRQSIEMFEKLPEAFPALRKAFEQAAAEYRDRDPEDLKRQGVLINAVGMAVLLLIAILGLWGSINMLRVQGYAMALTGAIATALPCLSPSGCCCGVGQIIALWGLIVLLNEDVRNCFR